MENKAIDIEPKAATEMQSWTNIYDRVPYQFAIHQNIQNYTGRYTTKVTGQSQYFEVLQLDMGIIRVKPLYNNQTNTMRTCTLAVTAMGKTTYIYLSQDANPFS